MRARFLFMFFGTWLIYLAFLPPGIYSIDGYSMLAVADSIVTRHNVAVPAGLGIPGKDGLILFVMVSVTIGSCRPRRGRGA